MYFHVIAWSSMTHALHTNSSHYYMVILEYLVVVNKHCWAVPSTFLSSRSVSTGFVKSVSSQLSAVGESMSRFHAAQHFIFLFSFYRNKECPTCRKKLISKRSLRSDPNFDALINKVQSCESHVTLLQSYDHCVIILMMTSLVFM